MSQLMETISARLTEAPLALKAHALVVLLAWSLIGGGYGALWFSILVLAIVQWSLLGGSRLTWWIEAAGVGISLAGLWGAWGFVTQDAELSAFVSTTTIALAALLLATALALLLTPAARNHCDYSTRSPLGAFGLALAAVFVGPFTAMALSVEPRLPSRGEALERIPNRVYVGTDHGAPSVFYVGGLSDKRCVVILEPRSSSGSCYTGAFNPEHLHSVRTEHVMTWVLPRDVVRVDVVYDGGLERKAESFYRPDAAARIFYTTFALDDVVGIRAYDAHGGRFLRCHPC